MRIVCKSAQTAVTTQTFILSIAKSVCIKILEREKKDIKIAKIPIY